MDQITTFLESIVTKDKISASDKKELASIIKDVELSTESKTTIDFLLSSKAYKIGKNRADSIKLVIEEINNCNSEDGEATGFEHDFVEDDRGTDITCKELINIMTEIKNSEIITNKHKLTLFMLDHIFSYFEMCMTYSKCEKMLTRGNGSTKYEIDRTIFNKTKCFEDGYIFSDCQLYLSENYFNDSQDRNMVRKISKLLIKHKVKIDNMDIPKILPDKIVATGVETILDKKINSYNNYSNEHPMPGVTWDFSKNRYVIRIGNNKITRFSKKNDAIDNCFKQTINCLQKKGGKNGNDITEFATLFFDYSGHFFVTYWKDNEPYFDIQHLLSIIGVEESVKNKKYNTLKNKIVEYTYFTNEWGGKIIRELVSESSMYEIIMSSNSTVSKSFKSDVSKILVELRKKGMLNVNRDGINLNKNNSISQIDYPFPK
jgi:prophage antirepressor-like protein